MTDHHRSTESVREGLFMGAILAMTVYGLVIVFMDSATKTLLVPKSTGLVAVVLVAVALVGAVIGGAIDRRRR